MFENLKFKIAQSKLKKNELGKFTSFCLYLNKNSHRVKTIFRGENYENLKRKLNLQGDNNFTKLSYFTFLIGEKGRVYRQEYKDMISKKNRIYSIDNTDEEFYNYIFDKLNRVFKEYKRADIIQFKFEQNYFYKYFLKEENKESFVKKINDIQDEQTKIKIRDYYLNLIHQIGKIGFYNKSFFTSTTTKYSIAKDFTLNKNNSDRIVFVSWVTYPLNRIGVTFNYLNKTKNLISSFNLPIYKKSFFPKQREISIKGGLLPHYILGYIRLNTNEFEVNPHFFETNKSFNEIVQNGFEIDQTLFHSALNETDYTGYFILNSIGEYKDFNK